MQPEKFLTYQLDVAAMKSYFASVPELRDDQLKNNAPIIILPMPDGTKAKFKIWKSSVMAPELAAKFPQIITLTGQGVDDPYATIKLDFTELGFHAQIKSVVSGDNYIDPYSKTDNSNYVIYKKSDVTDKSQRVCGTKDEDALLQKKKRTKVRYPKRRNSN